MTPVVAQRVVLRVEAAAGLLGGMLDGMRKRDPDPVHRNFVTRCLQKKGYEVIGWQ